MFVSVFGHQPRCIRPSSVHQHHHHRGNRRLRRKRTARLAASGLFALYCYLSFVKLQSQLTARTIQLVKNGGTNESSSSRQLPAETGSSAGRAPAHHPPETTTANDDQQGLLGRAPSSLGILGKAIAPSQNSTPTTKCAIIFYGLPRAFKSLVLPSIIRNIIIPNAHYECHYFVHYYEKRYEKPGRSGTGGDINPEEILLLKEQVELVWKNYTQQQQEQQQNHHQQRTAPPSVYYVKESDGDFWKQYSGVVEKVRKAKGSNGRLLYYPWRDRTYVYPTTTDNIIKQWHSIRASWKLMERTAEEKGVQYDRVAMLRSDVMYMTPIDIYDKGSAGEKDRDNSHVVIPGFSRFPVSDRLIYGPHDAVRIWAAERFDRMDDYARWVLTNRTVAGYGIQPERFMIYSILPAIEKLGVKVTEHDTMCFLRARTDETVWINDCSKKASDSVLRSLPKDPKLAVERIIGRKCGKVTVTEKPPVESLNCSSALHVELSGRSSQS